jgi:hypothetical protein
MRSLLGVAAAILSAASAAKPPAQLFLAYYSGVSPSVRLVSPSAARGTRQNESGGAFFSG